jgi:hypothetical protein
MAVLLVTNSQWQQQQQVQARMQQEELQRRRMEEEAAARAQAQNRATPIDPDLPWFYSDPQNNIQVSRNFLRNLWQDTICLTRILCRKGSFPWRGNETVARGWIF